MKLTIEFDCDNASFDDDLISEVNYVVHGFLTKSRYTRNPEHGDKVVLQDSNGNTVGHATWSE